MARTDLALLLGLPRHEGGLQGRVPEGEPEGVLRGAPAVGPRAAALGAVRVAAVAPAARKSRARPLPEAAAGLLRLLLRAQLPAPRLRPCTGRPRSPSLRMGMRFQWCAGVRT